MTPPAHASRRPVQWHYICPGCGRRTGATDPTLAHCPIPWLPDGTHPAGADLSTMTPCGTEYEDGPYAYYDELVANGLLADPTTSRTDAEQAVIDAAKRLNVFVGAGVNDRTVKNVIADLCAAVDRLAAPGPKEATT